MFYHIAMMRLSGKAGTEFHAQVEAFAGRVRRESAGLVDYGYGVNVAGRGKGYDHVVLSIFESSAAHDNYQVSPVHQAMKSFMAPYIEDLVVCDTDLPLPAPIPARVLK